MVTDASPRKTNSAGFLESDRIKTLDLPQDGCLPKIANSIEEAMKAGKSGFGAAIGTRPVGIPLQWFRYFETRKYRTGQKQSFDN
jgi:hypothetical protein